MHPGERKSPPETEGGARRRAFRQSSARLLCPLLIAVTFSLAAGCQEERRVPYIPPTLHNWKQPYRGVRGLRLHVFHAGTLRVREGLVLRGGSMTGERELPIMAYVLQHPRKGLVVLDTGLNRRFAEDAATYLGGLLRFAVTGELGKGQELPAQMRHAHLDPDSVRWVILSDLRFRHTGEVEAFPKARVAVAAAEHKHSLSGSGPYLQSEIDQVENWKFVDPSAGKSLGTMPAALDFFGDGSCMLLDARGPSAGNLAFLIRLASRPVVLAEDLAPFPATVRHAAAPASVEDMDAWWNHIWRLKRFADLEPALLIIPGYDAMPLKQANIPEVVWHEPPDRTPTPGE